LTVNLSNFEMAQLSVTETITTAASLESKISTEHVYSDVVRVSMGEKESWSGDVNEAIADALRGCGAVDLIKVQCIIMTPEEGSSVSIGFCEAGSSESVETLSMKENGYNFVATAYNKGTRQVVELVPEDTLSRQIRPISSDLPMLCMKISKSKKTKVSVAFYIKVRGIRSRYLSFQ